MNATFQTRLENFYLKFRYLLFKNQLQKKDFSQRKLLYTNNFETLNDFDVHDKEFYNDNWVWFSKDKIHLTNNGLSISCDYDRKVHTSWQGTRMALYSSGMVSTRNKVMFPNGLWIVNAKTCRSWCAIWLLKNDYNVEGYEKKQIIPEIDIVEAFGNKGYVKQTVHYGYSDTRYKTKWQGTSDLFKCDNKFHDYGVECLPNGYNFYIDGILTSKFRSTDPEFVSNEPNYLILNNAADVIKENTEFVIKSIKFYE